MSMIEASLEILRGLFDDRPEALKVFDLQSLESQYLKEKLRDSGELFADAVNLWVTGRTGAGKTSLGNSLLDSDVMKSNGFQDCTDFIGYFRLTSNLRFWDTPGIGSNINYENINRAALLMEQLTGNRFSRPPVVPLKDADYLLIKDFSNCVSPGVEPGEETFNGWAMAFRDARRCSTRRNSLRFSSSHEISRSGLAVLGRIIRNLEAVKRFGKMYSHSHTQCV